MEPIRISCAGYPTRKHFDEFLNRFGILAPQVLDKNSDEPSACKKLPDKAGLEGYQEQETREMRHKIRSYAHALLAANRCGLLSLQKATCLRKSRFVLVCLLPQN